MFTKDFNRKVAKQEPQNGNSSGQPVATVRFKKDVKLHEKIQQLNLTQTNQISTIVMSMKKKSLKFN
jgi:hypothetical protein